MNLWLLSSDPNIPAMQLLRAQLSTVGTLTLLMPGDQAKGVPHYFVSRRNIPQTSQLATDPSFPYNLMAPELALSYELALAADQLCDQLGKPDLIVCPVEDALAYFLLQRCLTNLSPLWDVPFVVFASAELFMPVGAKHSAYRFPQYWVARLECFCLRGADAIVAADEAVWARILAELPDLGTPIVQQEQLPTFVGHVRNHQPRTLFPANTPTAQGVTLPPNSDEVSGLLSVVVPFYNLGNYVGAALESVANSAYRPLEVLIVDDGSRPDQRALLDRSVAQYPDLMRIITQPNSGLARTRNIGAEQTRGEFLAFLDADDTVLPTYFTKAIAVLQRHTNVSFISAWVELFGATAACVPTWNPEFPFLLGRNMMLEQVVLRRAHFLAYGRNDPSIAYAFEDHETWIRMVGAGCVGVNIPEVLARYRIRDASMLRSTDPEIQRYLMELIMARHPDLYRTYGTELFALQNANGAALDWNQPGVATIDYRVRLQEVEAAYQQLRGRLTIFEPLVQFVRRLRRPG